MYSRVGEDARQVMVEHATKETPGEGYKNVKKE
jgi:hypothetical protein